jgi:ligand-binding sensor domain-containing protein/putative methionine-R-sulfoxide reductase with GAF domain
LITLFSAVAAGQSNIAFRHLTTANGLSYSMVNDVCTDQQGNVWIATGNGLNMFNGKTVVKYHVTEFPALGTNNLLQIVCDNLNRIWVMNDQRNLVLIDNRRRLHKVAILDKGISVKTKSILLTQSLGIVLFTQKGFLTLNEQQPFNSAGIATSENFQNVFILGFDSLQNKIYKHIFKFENDRFLFSEETNLFVVNFHSGIVEKRCEIHSGNLLTKWGTDSVLMYNGTEKHFEILNIRTGAITAPYNNLTDQLGNKPDDYFIYAEPLSVDKYLFTTRKEGMYIFNRKTGSLYNYRHKPADASTIGSNQVFRIVINKDGWAFLVTVPYGLSYFNTREIIGTQSIFQDGKGKSYDSYITSIATVDNNCYYLGTATGLIEWNRNTNKTVFVDFKDSNGKPLLANEEIQTICFDKQQHLWISTTLKGILVMDKNRRLIHSYKNTGRGPGSIALRRAYILQPDDKGYIWVSGENGICKISSSTYEVDYFDHTPIAELGNTFISPVFLADENNLWIGVYDKGVLHYNFVTNKTEQISKANGLPSNYVFSINQDNNHNTYIGTDNGLAIVNAGGRIKVLGTKDGLLMPRIEALIADHKNNRMWIGNDIGLVCYTPEDSSMAVFDDRYGLSIYGFRVNAYYQNVAGEFILGTPRGIQYFYPNDLLNHVNKPNALIGRIETKHVISEIIGNEFFDLPATDNDVNFYFSSVDFSGHLNSFYQYKLSGIDTNWISVTDQQSVHYSSLPPGKYEIKLRVSNNGKNWQDAENTVSFNIAVPFWKSWWFKLLGILMGGLLIYAIVNYFRRKQKQQQEELETELVVTYFASQINKQQDTDALLWDIASNCISKLHFEDCVIYLLDEQRNVLLQKAAHGPKSAEGTGIKAPIEIPVGKGIVGAVCQSGVAAIIPDTTLDERYLVDDKRRFSEITVPIFIDGKVVGVIDSEHRRKNFFTQRHLTMLTTIAALCAGQLQLVKAADEKKKAALELLQNRQKALESRLQSLRLQMNPHFLFNALNSVQQMILANEEMVATKYLSRFSKLLRAILVHSDKASITLREELQILNLYIELESIRFKDAFQYSIECDESIDQDEVKVPTMLIQPFVENAIWHGLMHKEGDRKLLLSFTENNDWLQCIIEDNGVGREKARAIRGFAASGVQQHQSKGIAVSIERLLSLKTASGETGQLEFIDLKNKQGVAAGTRVVINFPNIN